MKEKTKQGLTALVWVSYFAVAVFWAGCSAVPKAVSEQSLAAFIQAGSPSLKLDSELLFQAACPKGEYHVVPGDVLELQMPSMLHMSSGEFSDPAQIEEMRILLCRVQDDGTIRLPIAGDVSVVGLTLPQIEHVIQDAYCPQYVFLPPPVISRIAQYKTERVTITGAINKPGHYMLPKDQMTLVSILMQAGGIVDDGATVIHVIRKDSVRNNHSESVGQVETSRSMGELTSIVGVGSHSVFKSLVLPVKGLNIPFADIQLKEGDVIEVERIGEQVFTVIGLVKKPGTFSYPPEANYNLPVALAVAGGVNDTADPQYVHVYRPTPAGDVVDAVFSIKAGQDFLSAMNIFIKPGDVLAVEHTDRTRRNLLLSDILSLRAGVALQYQQ
ncbi:MAG: SLBB domain-containing protein [Sedimentisphaerales bacterium]|nr:SLBB domain-containing protein [Sedimentisphaerales bacterium]